MIEEEFSYVYSGEYEYKCNECGWFYKDKFVLVCDECVGRLVNDEEYRSESFLSQLEIDVIDKYLYKRYLIQDMEESVCPTTGKRPVHKVSILDMVNEINRDRSCEWTAYGLDDWEEGLSEWTQWKLIKE